MNGADCRYILFMVAMLFKVPDIHAICGLNFEH